MATLNEVKSRITSVQNTQKITRAMKIVAATKLKKREREGKRAEKFSKELTTMLTNIVGYSYDVENSLLFARDEIKTIALIIYGSDRGLCGSFNTNLFRNALDYIKECKQKTAVKLILFGNRTIKYFKRTGEDILFQVENVEQKDSVAFSHDTAQKITEAYNKKDIDRCEVIANAFISRKNFGYKNIPMLPIEIPATKERTDSLYLYEESVEETLDYLLPLYLGDRLYRILIESQTAEELSRMMAMDYATENAEELIGELTLTYNRTRQSVITKEISEIVGGAEALK